MKYRGYTITHNKQPIAIRTADWQFVADDYDGPPDNRCGVAPSCEACKEAIDELKRERTASLRQ